jgi:hypothetical protein
VRKLSGNRPATRWLLILTPLIAVINATLTITLPAAHQPPLGVVLLTVSAACWLTVLLAARRLHHIPTAGDRTKASSKTVQRRPAPHRRV